MNIRTTPNAARRSANGSFDPVGFSSIFGHMVDVGGSVPGSMPSNARTIWEEGLRVPPVKIYDKGVLNQGVLEIMLNNSRTPRI